MTLGSSTATVLSDGRVLLVGNPLLRMGDDEQELSCAFLYRHMEYRKDCKCAWLPILPLKIGRRGHTVTLLLNGSVLMADGQRLNSGGVSLKDFVAQAELYVPGVAVIPGRGKMRGDMKQVLVLHITTLLLDGSVMIVGGSQSVFNNMSPFTSVEVYEPVRVK